MRTSAPYLKACGASPVSMHHWTSSISFLQFWPPSASQSFRTSTDSPLGPGALCRFSVPKSPGFPPHQVHDLVAQTSQLLSPRGAFPKPAVQQWHRVHQICARPTVGTHEILRALDPWSSCTTARVTLTLPEIPCHCFLDSFYSFGEANLTVLLRARWMLFFRRREHGV